MGEGQNAKTTAENTTKPQEKTNKLKTDSNKTQNRLKKTGNKLKSPAVLFVVFCLSLLLCFSCVFVESPAPAVYFFVESVCSVEFFG